MESSSRSSVEPLERLRDALAQFTGAEGLGDSACATIGRTPAVRLVRLGSEEPRAEIIAKLESRNPGGSLKDRTALGMVLEARAA